MILPVALSLCGCSKDLSRKGAVSKRELGRFEAHLEGLYQACSLSGLMGFDCFRTAMIAFYNLKGRGSLPDDRVITVIDYTKPSTEEPSNIIPSLNMGSSLSAGMTMFFGNPKISTNWSLANSILLSAIPFIARSISSILPGISVTSDRTNQRTDVG